MTLHIRPSTNSRQQLLPERILFWWPILRPWPSSMHGRNWGILIYLVSADVVNTLLSAFLSFYGRPVYSYYVDNPNPFHIPPLEDQVLGAVIMWVIGSLAFLLPAMLIAMRLLRPTRLLAQNEDFWLRSLQGADDDRPE